MRAAAVSQLMMVFRVALTLTKRSAAGELAG